LNYQLFYAILPVSSCYYAIISAWGRFGFDGIAKAQAARRGGHQPRK